MALSDQTVVPADAVHTARAAQILRISWDEAWHIMERAVMRGRAAKGRSMPSLLGVDEKAIAKGHSYMTLVCDLQAATVEYIGEERREASLDWKSTRLNSSHMSSRRRHTRLTCDWSSDV